MTKDACNECNKKEDCDLAKNLSVKVSNVVNKYWKEKNLNIDDEICCTIYVLARLVGITAKIGYDGDIVDSQVLLNNVVSGLIDGFNAIDEDGIGACEYIDEDSNGVN